MKQIFIFLIILFCSYSYLYPQCQITAGINSASADRIEICEGTTINLQSAGICNYLMNNNFNNGQMGAGWQSNATPMFSNPCGAGSDGSTYLWVGSAASFPRDLTTAPFDVSAGACRICFDLRFAVQGQNSPCEGPDEIDEGVSLQYSVNNGNWQNIVYFRPDGTQQPSNAWVGQSTSSGSGNTPFTTWHNYCFVVPPAAVSTSTRFRWHQEQVTDNEYDHWGIDNVNIYCPAGQDITWSANPLLPPVFPYNGANVNNVIVPVGTTVFTAYVVDPLNANNNASDNVTVIVHPIPISPFTINTSICSDQTATITYTGLSTSSATYTWNFQGGTVISGSGMGPYQVRWTNGGTYNVSLTVSEYGCSSTSTSHSIIVYQQPTSSFTLSSPICTDANSNILYSGNASANASYQWNFNGGNIISGSGQGPIYVNWVSGGNYDVSLQVTENGCTSILTTLPIIVYNLPTATFTLPTNVCSALNGDIVYTGNGTTNSTYLWNFDGGTIVSGSNSGPYSINWQNAGNHSITLTVTENNCTSVLSQQILVFQSPTADFNSDRIDGCEPLNVHFFDQSIPSSLVNNWLWNFGNSNTATIKNPNQIYSDGSYSVFLQVRTSDGCYDTITKPSYITAYQKPFASFDANPILTSRKDNFITFTNHSVDEVAWDWNYEDNTAHDNIENPTHSYLDPGEYDVVLIVSTTNGCLDTANLKITIIEDELVIPNVITPNGDGSNDFFDITYLVNYKSNTLIIYNRWGKKIYDKKNYSPAIDRWDGNSCGDGTYFFVLQYEGTLRSGETMGSITVIGEK